MITPSPVIAEPCTPTPKNGGAVKLPVLRVVEFTKTHSAEFGLSIAGGKDGDCFPNDSTVMVMDVEEDSPIFFEVQQGDAILAMNGRLLHKYSLDDTLEYCKNLVGNVTMVVEQKAEERIFSGNVLSNDVLELVAQMSVPKENNDINGREDSLHSKGSYPRLKEDDEFSESMSVHSYIDDVPVTPKRDHYANRMSQLSEVLYVGIGLAVIGVATYAVVRMLRSRK